MNKTENEEKLQQMIQLRKTIHKLIKETNLENPMKVANTLDQIELLTRPDHLTIIGDWIDR